jgi:DNA-binding FadR family transcriptional regulator
MTTEPKRLNAEVDPSPQTPNVRSRAREVARQMREELEELIQSDAMGPGAKLPTEVELVDRFGASRSTVRKMLTAMETEGLIVRRVGSGTFVADSPPPVGGDVFQCVLDNVALHASPAEIMEFRLIVEPPAMSLVTRKATASDILEMQNCLAQSERAQDLAAFEHWDCELHTVFGRTTRNVMFENAYAMITAARNRAEWGRLKSKTLTSDMRALHMAEHVRIVAAVRDRDPEKAEAEMLAHLSKINRSMFP